MATAPSNDVLVATHVSPEMREAIRDTAKSRNIPMSRLLREMLEERFEVKERPRQPRAFSADQPKMDQVALDLDASTDDKTAAA